MRNSIKTAALSLAASGLVLAVPATAAPAPRAAMAPMTGTMAQTMQRGPVYGDLSAEHGRDRRDRRDRYDRYRDRPDYGRDTRPYYNRYPANYGQPVYAHTPVWRGDDGRYYCRRDNGTTGLLIGAGVGGLIGHEVAGQGGDRTLGVILGAGVGALLGRTIDRSSTRCG